VQLSYQLVKSLLSKRKEAEHDLDETLQAEVSFGFSRLCMSENIFGTAQIAMLSNILAASVQQSQRD